MNEFSPGQRWVSQAEPELGLGIVLEIDKNRLTIVFPASGERRIYAQQSAPLARVSFSAGDEVESSDNIRLTVEKVVEHNGVLTYYGSDSAGKQIRLDEIDLNHTVQFNRPQERLFMGQADPARWFSLRHESWLSRAHLEKGLARGLMGARASLISHQLYIANEVANRQRLRVMLADEVGLGKTIEAGLILHHRLLNELSRRVLILVPEPLLHQWLVEMLRRFNLRFSIFDEERCLQYGEENPFVSEQLILCSIEFFGRHQERKRQAVESGWDIVVVDEAHHLEWSDGEEGDEYRFVETLSACSPGLILLSATPEQLGKKSHFARLRLLDPDRFYSFEKFVEEEQEFEPVANAASQLMEQKKIDSASICALRNMMADDRVEKQLEWVNDSEKGLKARSELIEALLDYHGTGRVLFRNSRKTVSGFPVRHRYGYPLEAADDSGAEEMFNWLISTLGRLNGQKVVLICSSPTIAVALGQMLKRKSSVKAAVFHEGLSIVERDRAAAWFADSESAAQLLVCSEIGSEGRNFQFAHHLIFYDLPENPDLLQQRIGRLDRIGQQEDIHIHIPFVSGSRQALLFRWYDEGLNLFLKNSEAAQIVYTSQHGELEKLCEEKSPEQVDLFIEETGNLRKEIEEELHEGRDRLLELNSCKESVADGLIKAINTTETEMPVWPYVEKVFDCFGIDSEFHSKECFIVRPGNHMRLSSFPDLPEEGMTVTVERETALAREELHFLSWEHPMVSSAMDLVLSSETGNAAVSVVKSKKLKPGKLLLEALFIVECSAPASLQLRRFLPPTPVRTLLDQSGRDIGSLVPHESLEDAGYQLESEQLLELVKGQKPLVEKLLALSEQVAEKEKVELVRKASFDARIKLEAELERLRSLKVVNSAIRDEDLEAMKETVRLSSELLNGARLKLDAVRLVITS